MRQANPSINESLDFDAAMQGALDSARFLTRARYGVMTLIDDEGQVRDFLSSEMTGEETEQVWMIPQRWQLFEYRGCISGPLRIPGLMDQAISMGLAEFRPALPVGQAVPFLASPVFHRGQRVGNIFLADKDGGEEFTRADEESLVMFASPAALDIANARTYRDEQQPRNDL